MRSVLHVGSFILLSLLLVYCNDDSNTKNEWREYLGGPDRNHYSSLDQINIENVKRLQVAWEYNTKTVGRYNAIPLLSMEYFME